MTDLKQALIQAVEECPTNLGQPPVLGEGNHSHPPLLLVGEAPGEQETLEGRPFVGKAGKNLMEFLGVLGISREAIYITNVVKFRPVKVSDKGRFRNRTPTRKEIAAFTPLLLREIRQVNPQLIVTLGNTPLSALTGRSDIGEAHGRLSTVDVDGEQYPLFPLYHPAAIIYNRALKDVYNQDILTLRGILTEGK